MKTTSKISYGIDSYYKVIDCRLYEKHSGTVEIIYLYSITRLSFNKELAILSLILFLEMK